MSMKLVNMEQIAEERPQLHMELEWRKVSEVWLLNNVPTGPDAERVGKKTWILLAKGKEYDYLIQSQAGTKNRPDSYITWIHYGRESQGGQVSSDGYIVIDKSKLGRKRRELSEEEVQEIRTRHEAGEGINRIAKAMHLGTKRITAVLKGVI